MPRQQFLSLIEKYAQEVGALGIPTLGDSGAGLGAASQQQANVPLNVGNSPPQIQSDPAADQKAVQFLIDQLDTIKTTATKTGGNNEAQQQWQDALNSNTITPNVKQIIGKDGVLNNFSGVIENIYTILDPANPYESPAESVSKHFNLVKTRLENIKSLVKDQAKQQQELLTASRDQERIMKISAKEEKEKSKKDAEEESEEEAKEDKRTPKTSYEKAKEHEEGERGKGKKSNPFRVLMGIVGKLYDHGWSSSDIVRHVKKHTKFNTETIKESIKIIEKSEKKKAQASSGGGITKLSSYGDIPEEYGVYSIKEEWNKKSTRELITRLSFLVDCQKYDPESDNGRHPSMSSLDGEITLVTSALKRRGYDSGMIDHLKQKIRNVPYLSFAEGE